MSCRQKIENGWFIEKNNLWPGQAFALEVEEVLHEEKTLFQDLMVFKSKTYGNVLVLDGVLQLTEKDQFAYQELITHLPLFSHANPEAVCVIGGGDGAVLAQVLKHKSVKSVVLCEIDQGVIDASKKYFPQFLKAFNDPRVKIHCADGRKYLDENPNTFDAVIVDSSDPVGPAEVLFQKEFYEIVAKSLKEDGVVCTQAECFWVHQQLIKQLLDDSRTIFARVGYAYTMIPSYPCGQIGLLVASKANNGQSLRKPVRTVNEALVEEEKDRLQYYSEEIHSACFVLPAFAQRALQ